MKQTNDKKQDLLLDALSCIDEDILERGLALRDGAAAPAPKAAEHAPKTSRLATVMPPLYDLTRQPDKPPKKNPWRVISVVAAACLLLCVVSLSMWMVGSMSKNEAAGDNFDGTMNGQNGMEDGAHTGLFPNFRPNQDPDPDDMIPEEAPQEPIGTHPPVEEEPDAELTPSYNPERLSWTAIPIPYPSNQVIYHTWGKNGTEMRLQGTVMTSDAPQDSTVSPEDQLVLELLGQWMLSVMSLDYAAHFPLFRDEFVEKRFLSQIAEKGFSYDEAITRIRERTSALFPIQDLTLDTVLTCNRLMTGAELESYRQDLADGVLDPNRITAVRHFTFTGVVTLNRVLQYDLSADGINELFCYEYDGVWYLDHSLMDDDLSVDLLLSDPISDTGYFKTQTATVAVDGIEHHYLVTEDGTVFFAAAAEIYSKTDNGKWERVSFYDIPTEGNVTVTYYAFSGNGITILGREGSYILCTAATIRIGE